MNFHSRRIALAAVSLPIACASPLHAQLDAVEGLFEEVNAVTIFVQRGQVAEGSKLAGDDLRGAGVEVLIDLVNGGWVDLELGLGTSFLRGYETDDPALELRTSARALPTVSLYASKDFAENRAGILSGYAGGSFGLLDLWNAQAYDAEGSVWDLEAQTFELGGSVGAYWTTPAAIGVFAEAGYRQRKFPSVKWTTPDEASVPEDWRSLDLSGYYLQFGLQLRVNEDEPDEDDVITPPAPAGVWTLARIDGVELPIALNSRAPADSLVVHGVLRLTPHTAKNDTSGTGSYSLDLYVRGVPAGTADLPQHEGGSYATADNVLTFTPDAGGRAQRAERLAGRLYLTWNGHVLVFAPGSEAEAEDDS